MMSSIAEELRGWWKHPLREAWCAECGTRAPCDWNLLVAEAEEAADEMDRQTARISELEAMLPELRRTRYPKDRYQTFGFTWAVSDRELAEAPREALVSWATERFELELRRALEEK